MASISLHASSGAAGTGSVTARRWGLLALWCALALQATWMAGIGFAGPGPGELGAFDNVAVTVCGLLAVTSGRVSWIAAVARIWIGLMFLGSVGDRFGLLGEPGAAGVSWGSWAAFVHYTREVNAFLPDSFAPVLAVLATAAELVLGLGLLAGVKNRYVALGAAALLVVFGVAMTVSLGAAAPFPYSVWVLGSASFALAWSNASRFGLDVIRRRVFDSV